MLERAKFRDNGCSCSQAAKPYWQAEGSTTIPVRDVITTSIGVRRKFMAWVKIP